MNVPQKTTNLRLHVMKLLYHLIENGSFKVGSRLPPERRLAEQFKVSRTSIREAIRALEAIGILESRRSAGNIVLAQPSSIMVHSCGVAGETEAQEILETRRGLELEAVRLVAERITKEQGETLQCYIGEMRLANSEALTAAIEAGFHRQIIEYAGNRLLQQYFNSIMQMAKDRDIFSTYSNPKLMLEIHDELCESMVENRSATAEMALNRYYELLLAVHGLSA